MNDAWQAAAEEFMAVARRAWQRGLVAVGSTLSAAESIAELVEETSQIAVLVRLGGGEVESCDE